MKISLPRSIRRLCVCAVISVFLAAPGVFGQSINHDVHKLLKVSGTTQMMEQVIDAMIVHIKQMQPGIPDVFWNKLKAKLTDGEFLDMFVPVYTKHYTHDEIKQLLKFYDSPIGRKMVKVSPAMLQESMAIGEKFGEKIGQEIAKELQAAGF
jgi:hypothetical protein